MKIYLPYNEQKTNLFTLWKEMFVELAAGRELIWQLFRRDFLASYKQSFLGYLWALIMPLAIVAAFIFLNRSGLITIGATTLPYALYAVAGLSIWQLFSSGLIVCANSLVSGGGLITKINFPKESLVISALGRSIFEFLIRIFLLAVLFAIYKVTPPATVILLPLAIIPVILFTIALGFLFSLLNGLLRDTANILSLGVTFLLFLTPVLYPLPSSKTFVILNTLNIPGILVTSARDLLLSGTPARPLLFLGACVVSLLAFIISWTVFHLVEPIIAERI